MRRTENDRPSRFEWLGDIPGNWGVCRNIGLFKERKEINQPDMQLLSVTINRGVIKQEEIIEKKDGSNEDKSKYKVVRQDDLAYNKMRMWQGAIGRSEYEGIVSPAYVILAPWDKLYSRYYHYLYRTEAFISEANRHSYGLCLDMNSLRYEDFKTIYSPVPPRSEVERIVAFLDQKTSEIDAAIERKERLIGLLVEQKATLICQIVTKGLNFGVPLRDSGVSWIGNIPKHWKVTKLKHVSSRFMYGTSVECNSLSYGTPVLRIPNISESALNLSNLKFANLSKQEEERYAVNQNDFLVVRTNGNPKIVGRSCFVEEINEKMLFASYLIKFMPRRSINPKYLAISMNSVYVRSYLSFMAQTSVGNYNLNIQSLGDTNICIPPQDEQLAIVEYINVLEAKFDVLIKNAKKEIKLLREMSASVITTCVFGRTVFEEV